MKCIKTIKEGTKETVVFFGGRGLAMRLKQHLTDDTALLWYDALSEPLNATYYQRAANAAMDLSKIKGRVTLVGYCSNATLMIEAAKSIPNKRVITVDHHKRDLIYWLFTLFNYEYLTDEIAFRFDRVKALLGTLFRPVLFIEQAKRMAKYRKHKLLCRKNYKYYFVDCKIVSQQLKLAYGHQSDLDLQCSHLKCFDKPFISSIAAKIYAG